MAYTQSSGTGTLYLNGIKEASGAMTQPTTMTRTSNYFGKSNSATSSANAFFDDIMFFNVALTSTEINTVKNLFVPNAYNFVAYCLVNQWTFNQNVYDSITSLSLSSPYNIQFVADRLGAINSAVYSNAGNLLAPTANYFYGDLSVTAWVYVISAVSNSVLLSCATSSLRQDDVVVAFNGGRGKPYFTVYNTGSNSAAFLNTVNTLSKKWTHYAVTLTGNVGQVYFDGVSQIKSTMATPRNISRTNCYIGGLSDTTVPSNAYIDDLMFFKYALSTSEILTVMNAYWPNDFNRLATTMTNQWTFNQNLFDQVAVASLSAPVNVIFTSDRIGGENAALYLNYGSLTAPTASYFSGAFASSVWVYYPSLPSSSVDYGYVFNFGDGSANVNLKVSSAGWLAAAAYNSGQTCVLYVKSSVVSAGKWNHLAATQTSTKTLTAYVNGVSVGNIVCANLLTSSTRPNSMIGQTNSANNMLYNGRLF